MNNNLRRADSLQDEGKNSEARRIYDRLLQQFPDRDATEPRAHVLNGLSNPYATDGDFGKTVDFARRAVETYRAIGDGEGGAYALNNLGIAEGELGTYSAAGEHFKRAIFLTERATDFETQICIWNNLGN